MKIKDVYIDLRLVACRTECRWETMLFAEGSPQFSNWSIEAIGFFVDAHSEQVSALMMRVMLYEFSGKS